MSDSASQSVMEAAATALRQRLGAVRLTPVASLGGSYRSNVWRAAVHGRSDVPATVVIKAYQGEDAAENWARESAALAVVGGSARVPPLLAAASVPPVAVLEDLGEGGSVADALLGSDPDAASAAVAAWAAAVAALHAATLDASGRFASALAARGPDLTPHAVPVMLAGAVRMLSKHAAALDLSLDPEALDALRALGDRLTDDDHAALSPGDTCPDNNLWRGERLHLLDFEWAERRHVAWDAAYLLVPWPTCWCSWQLPAGVADECLRRYRQQLGKQLPYVLTSRFDADLAAAVLGWTLVSTAWFLERAIAGDPPPSPPSPPAPHCRALILHRLTRARTLDGPAALGQLVTELDECLRRRWGRYELAVAPAWRTDSASV